MHIRESSVSDSGIRKRSLGKKCLLCCWLESLILSGLVLLPLWTMAAELTIPYDVAIKGVEDGKLLKAMEDASDAVSLKDRPPASLALLRNRVEKDKERFIEMLRSVGYYEARVETEMDTESKPVQVVFQITTGPAYVLKSFDVKLSQPRGPELPGADRLGLSLGAGFKAEVFLAAEKNLLEILGTKGFPFAKILDRKIIVNHETCIGCRACEKACPSTVMGAILKRDRVIPDCFACGTCIEVCPTGSIQLTTGKRGRPPEGRFLPGNPE